MARGLTRRCASLTLLFLSLAVPAAASGTSAQSGRDVLLDLPYLTQTEQLCGGAALAMVLRYWGAHDVVPQDFAALIVRGEAGIRTSALTKAVTDRGWQAVVVNADAAGAIDPMRHELRQGRPIIALLELSPGVYHYVVIVGATADQVVLHDPARAPYRVVARAEFERQWASAGRWMLLVLPPAQGAPVLTATATATTAANAPPAHAASGAAGPCDALVEENVALAVSGNQADAERGLLTAVSLCPAGASGWQELAGLRFVQQRFAEAGAFAEHALRLAPDDANTWHLLATTRYLRGDFAGALAAWNRVGEPRTDTVSVEGATRTRQPVIVNALGLAPRQILTPGAFTRAARRLDALPIAAASSLRYRSLDGGSAAVNAVITERPVVPKGRIDWTILGAGAALRRELIVPLADLSGDGEVTTVGYRWAQNRPRVRAGFEVPAPGPLPGIVGIDAMWERQSYAPLQPGDGIDREDRRRAGAHLADWATSWLRWQVGGAVDRFADRDYAAVDGSLNTRWLDDRVAATLSAGYWAPAGSGAHFADASFIVDWRTARSATVPKLIGRAGISTATAAAPLALWPVASSSSSRGELLRAHDLVDDGVMTDGMLGRQLAFANVEYQHPLYAGPFATITAAGFADVARVWRGRDGAELLPWQVDLGSGLRINSRRSGGEVRIDFAYGLRNKHTSLSAGYVIPWGR